MMIENGLAEFINDAKQQLLPPSLLFSHVIALQLPLTWKNEGEKEEDHDAFCE